MIGALTWTFLSIAAAYSKGIIAGIVVSGLAGGIIAMMFINDCSGNGNGLPFVG